VNEITSIIKKLDAIVSGLQKGCPLDTLPEDCGLKIRTLHQSIVKLQALAEDHEHKDDLIDKMYFVVGSKLNTTFDLNELLGVIIDSLGKIIEFNAAGIFLLNDETGQIEADFVRGYHFDYFRKIKQKVGEGILGWVIENRQSLNLGDISKDNRYINARPETKSEAAVPLISESRVIGCINLENDRLNAFSDQDLALLETFATQASLAVERARFQQQLLEKKILEEEVAIARRIQSSLLPKDPPEYPGYDRAGINIPSRSVGGDYYDFIPLKSGLGLAIADVSGKGIGAALIMSGFRAALRSEVRHNLTPAELLYNVNHFVFESTESGDYITAFFGELKGDRMLYSNAGHNPPIFLHNDGSYELLEKGGLVLGIEKEQTFEEGEIRLHSGDTVLFYTDGVTEGMNKNDEEYGLERLIKSMLDVKDLPVEERIEKIYRRLIEFTGGLNRRDDLTLMILSRK